MFITQVLMTFPVNQTAIPNSYIEALEAHLQVVRQNQLLIIENERLANTLGPGMGFQPGLTPTQFCRQLNGVNSQKINSLLLKRRWIYDTESDQHHSPRHRVYSLARDKYLTESALNVSRPGKKPFLVYTLVLLPYGAKRLWEMYLRKQLPMKTTWDGEFRHSCLMTNCYE